MFECLFGFFPILLFDLNLRFHQHEDWVVSDAEVLRERLLKEVVSGTHISSIRVDDSGEDVCFDDSWIFVKAIVDLAQCAWRVIKEPTGLSQEDLCLGKSRVLLRHVLE